MTTEKARRSEKIQMFDDVAKLLVGAGYVYFVSYKGLKNKDFTAFRNELAKCDAECHVLKNRLIRKVAEANGMEDYINSILYQQALLSLSFIL